MAKTFTIVGQRVLVKPDPLEKMSKGGILVALNEKAERQATQSGVVVQVGELAYKDFPDGKPWCKVGDRIIYARHAGKFIADPETGEYDAYYMIKDEDVQGILTDDDRSS